MSDSRLVGHGVDTLVLNGYYTDERDRPVKREWDPTLALQLEEWKKQAQYASEPVPVPWVFHGSHLQMYPNGAGRGHWQWLLRSPWLSLCISRGNWKLIQGVFTQPCEVPEQFGKLIRKRREEHNIQKGIEATVGYATALSAWIGETLADPDVDLSVFLHWLAIHAEEYLQRKEMDFGTEVQRKRIKLGLQAS